MKNHALFLEPRVQRKILLILLAVLLAGITYLIKSFLVSIFAAAIFTGLTYPLYQKIASVVKKPFCASILTLLLLCLLFGLPLTLIGFLAWKEALQVLSHVNINGMGSNQTFSVTYLLQNPPEWVPDIVRHFIQEQITGENLAFIDTKIKAALKSAIEFLFYGGARLSMSFINGILTVLLAMFSMFYFYMDGPKILKKILYLSPIANKYQRRIIDKLMSATRATLKGSLLIGLIQGGLGGLLLWAMGIDSPVFWGIVMVVASVFPTFGTALILIPVAVFFVFKGIWVKALIVVICSTLIGVVDNIIRPALVGKDLKMHDLVILFSTLGGIGLFGIIGVVIGPMLAAVLMTVLDIYQEMFKADLDKQGS